MGYVGGASGVRSPQKCGPFSGPLPATIIRYENKLSRGRMGLLGRLRKEQRIGLFVGALIAVLVLLAHNPLNGYVTEVTWTCPPLTPACLNAGKGDANTMTQAEIDQSVEQARQCVKETSGAQDLPFSLWRSSDPIISWLGWVTHFIAFECAVVLLTILWVALNRESHQSNSPSVDQ